MDGVLSRGLAEPDDVRVDTQLGGVKVENPRTLEVKRKCGNWVWREAGGGS